MYQVSTIVSAVTQAVAAKAEGLVPAILKHYLLDTNFVSNTDRQDVLKAVNDQLKTKFSVTAIKKANPTDLNGLQFDLPAKEKAVVVEKVQGTTEVPAALLDPSNLSQEANIMSVTQTNTETTTTVAPQAAVPNGEPQLVKVKKEKKTKIKTSDDPKKVAKEEGLRFSKAFTNAFKREDGKKVLDHLAMTFSGDDLTDLRPSVVYEFMKPSIKVLLEVLGEVKGLDSKEARKETFEAWLEDSEKRGKRFKKFSKQVEDDVEKFDHQIGMFLLCSKDNIRTAASLASFAENRANSAEDDDDTYAFVRHNQEGINPRWSAGIAAVVGGGVDMAMNGFSVGSGVGTAVGAVAAFALGGELEKIESGSLRAFSAGAIGASLGIAGSRGGRYIEGQFFSSGEENMVDVGGSVVAHVPAQQVVTSIQPIEGSAPSATTGLASFLLG